MYKIGLSSCGFDLTEENFQKLAQSGIDALEVSLHWSQYGEIDYKALADLSQRYHIDLWSFHLPFSSRNSIDISSEDPSVRAKTVALHRELIEKAAAIGIQKFVLHPSGEPITPEARPLRMQYSMESLDTLAEIAHEAGAVLAVEDLPRSCLGNTAEDMLKLLTANDKLRVCFDTNHLLQDTNSNFIRKLGDKIITLHVSDYDFTDEKHWLPGEGKNNWQELYSLLQQANYRGVWMYELGLKAPESHPRSRDLTFDDFVRNARSIFENKPLQLI